MKKKVRVHSFENGVWMHRCDYIESNKADFDNVFAKCVHIDESKIKWNLIQRFIRSAVKVFAPLM